MKIICKSKSILLRFDHKRLGTAAGKELNMVKSGTLGGRATVEFDMGNIETIDSTGMAALLRMRERVGRSVTYIFRRPNEAITTLLADLMLDDLFKVDRRAV